MRINAKRLTLSLVLMMIVSEAGAQGMTGGMAGMTTATAPSIPPVAGFSEGAEIVFLHTEASDRGIAELLTDMMGSPVLFVPALALVPPEAKSRVYVFTNGATPEGARGPLGFQPDVFPNPPGDEGYTPLREIVRVTWANPASARVLRSAAEITTAASNGELATEPTGIIVNMPMVIWPAGQR